MPTSGAGRPGDYGLQAKTYDSTRGASPTVLRALAGSLGEGGGRSLLDVAGGTGNYAAALAAEGFRPTVLDASEGMLARVATKIGPGRAVAGDATGLPFPNGSFDAVTMINAIHLIDDPAAAMAETRRVIRDGPLVLTSYVRENAPLFLFEYFGLADFAARRRAQADVERLVLDAGFSRVERDTYRYTDAVDGSTNALHISAELLTDPDHLRNNSFWHRIDEGTRRRGLAALRHDLWSGDLERRVEEHLRQADRRGHGTVFTGWP